MSNETERMIDEWKGNGANEASDIEFDSWREAQAFLDGYEEGDPAVMGIEPRWPFSGEWAGESLPEIFGDWESVPSGEILGELEDAYFQGFWDAVVAKATEQAGTSPENAEKRYEAKGMEGIAVSVVRVVGDESAVIMVGDDLEMMVPTDSLREVGDDEYCGTCGQVGCQHG